MNYTRSTYRTLLSISFISIFPFAFAQTPSVKTDIDKNSILIGEQIKYTVKASIPSGMYRVHWFRVADSVAHFEVVERGSIDSSSENNNTIIEQTITFTSFDSGRWNTPSFIIEVDPVNNNIKTKLYSDSFAINVGYSPPDSTNQLRDIKPIMEVTIKNYFWYYVAGGILLLLIMAILLWRYLKNKKKEPVNVFTGKLSPYDEAMQELQKLKTLNLQKPADIKDFHAKLGVIFKWYISRKQRTSIMNKTTGDVLVHLSVNNLPADKIANAATTLRCSDAVKFAKFLPTALESEDCLFKIKDTISFINQPKVPNT